MIRIYLGHDRREEEAFAVAQYSIESRASAPVCVTPLILSRLQQQGLMRRPLEVGEYQTTDVISGAKQSTEFATSRFLVPFLAHSGFAIFMDCDVVCLSDIAELASLADPRFAVQVVKHQGVRTWRGQKMDGQEQTSYDRKNWSSVCIWNVDHPAHRRLTLDGVNGCRGIDLHQFWWLKEEEIGSLPSQWNVLVNVNQLPENPKLLHFTLGGPWLPNWTGAPHDEIWSAELASYHAAASRARDVGGGKGFPASGPNH